AASPYVAKEWGVRAELGRPERFTMAAQPFIAPASISIAGMTIRCYQPGDGPELRISTVSSYEHLRPWMPWATTEYTLEEAEARCRRLAARYLLNEDFTLGVWIGE